MLIDSEYRVLRAERMFEAQPLPADLEAAIREARAQADTHPPEDEP